MTAKQKLKATLWDIANTLYGQMSADGKNDLIRAISGIIGYAPQEQPWPGEDILGTAE
ncbi:MAG TPA: hypothetical protein PKD45_10060 [Flavobacteriales bacterium]|nr:hypothetical protein [Flavobacteriales bacterium]